MQARTVQAWLAAIVPEVADSYVAFVSQLPPRPWADWLGVTTRGLDLVLKPHLDWHGRAPAILVNDAALVQEAAGLVLGAGFSQEDAEWHAFGRVVLHEASHILNRPLPYYDPCEQAPALTVETLGALLSAPLEVLAELGPNVKVGGDHGAGFVRLACHLSGRAQRAGWDIRPSAVVPAEYLPDQPHASRCTAALGDEPERLAAWPVEAIKAVPPPKDFAALWAAPVPPPGD